MAGEHPLGRRLLALGAASIVPLALMAGVGLYALQAWQRAESERVGVELARSVANAVSAELRATQSVLETLATTPTLDSLEPAVFLERAARVLVERPYWIAIVLTDPAGTPLADTRARDDRAPFPQFEREGLDQAARTGAAVVGPLTRQLDRWLFPVRVPVRRDGATAYVLSALVSPDLVYEVLRRQDVPADWLISVVDSHGHRVARSRAHEENLGGRLSESVERVVAAGGVQGVGIAYALEGERILAPYSRVPYSGWTAVLGIPTAFVDAAVFRAVAFYGTGVALSLVIATLASVWLARTIARPVKALGLAAGAMARGERPHIPDSTIREIAAAGSALRRAFDDLQQAEAERDALLRAERAAREAAESSDRAKDQFLAVLSHELRTPLNAVSGWARMLKGGLLRDDPAITERAIDVIVRNADAQAQLIDDLLDLSRISAGKLRLRPCPTDLSTVVADVVEAVRPSARARDITLHAALAVEPATIMGDPNRLQQVIWNLMMNAVKFTPAGGSIEVELRRRNAHVEVYVRDTGRGIAPDLLPCIFDRFRQADSSSTREHGGLGLGLALVKTLVELHGGSVRAESAGDGCGSTFTVVFPLAEAPPATPGNGETDTGNATIPTGDTPAAALNGLRVLIVDDDADGRLLGHEVLRRAGAEVRTCSTAGSAFELLQSWRPDVLVSDIEMPGEDGYQLIRRIRLLPTDAGGETPAIALTAYGRSQDRRRALDAGFNVHLPKPVDPVALTSVVAELAATTRAGAD